MKKKIRRLTRFGNWMAPPADTLKFVYFRQANESLSRNFEGAGLGLSIAKAYVEILGGKIWVESESVKGSVFSISVPFYEHYPDYYVVDDINRVTPI
jgi:signal transduction histidine kinase